MIHAAQLQLCSIILQFIQTNDTDKHFGAVPYRTLRAIAYESRHFAPTFQQLYREKSAVKEAERMISL